MKRSATVIWNGSLLKGNGKISTESGALKDADYSFGTRFETNPGTNPEELIAAAHASCFSMAFSHELEKAGISGGAIETTATLTLSKKSDGWAINGIELATLLTANEADQATFEKAARAAKENCPISKLLNAPIEFRAELKLDPAAAVMAS